MTECKPNYKNICDRADRQMWLKDHEKNMTDEEHEEFWNLMRTIIIAEVDMDNLYEKIKKRVGE